MTDEQPRIGTRMDEMDTHIIGSIGLTDEEQEWDSGINWRLEGNLREDVGQVYRQNAPLVVPLIHSLLGRDAIPSVRRRYLTDPKLNVGNRRISVVGAFERNGCSGDEMIADLNFLKYAWYMIHGAKLPEATKYEFLAAATDWLADLSTTTKKAGQLLREDAREGRLSRRDVDNVHEEFHKLALDCGLDDFLAGCVRDHVMRARLPIQKGMPYAY